MPGIPSLRPAAAGRVHLPGTLDGGNYDVYYRRFDGESFRPVQPITTSPRFEAHAAVAEDRFGRVWLAWDEAGANWGKDTGFLVKSGAGEGLYEQREIRAVVLAESRMLAAPPLVLWLSGGGKEFLEQPQLAADSNGNVWCLVRRRATKMHEVCSQALQRNRLQQYSFWEYGLYRFAGSVASPIPLPFSWGRNDLRAAMAAAPGGRVALAWAADGRSFAKPYPFVKNEVFVSDIPGVPYGEPALQPILEKSEPVKPVHPGEDREVARMRAERDYRRRQDVRVIRGDMHRHTDLSFDGDLDGSLWDFYRYSIDAANFDYAALTDHNAGDDNEYLWWLIQKSNDLFFYPGSLHAALCLRAQPAIPERAPQPGVGSSGCPDAPSQRRRRSRQARGAAPLRIPSLERRPCNVTHLGDPDGDRLARQRSGLGTAGRGLSG